MSTKPELETWAAAVDAYDAGEYETALELFSRIERSSRFVTNMGLIYAALGENEAAVEQFTEATGFDPYLAVAYFQCGVSNFLLARYELAYEDFERAMLALRGTQNINYEQLGLESCLNQGLSLIYMGRTKEGLADLEEARRAKATDEHNVIDEAIAELGKDFTVFSIKKMKNIKAKDYLGTAILVAASDSRDTTVGFSGNDRLKQGITPAGVFVEGETVRARNNTGAPTAPRNDDGPPPLVRPKATLNVVSQPSAGGPARSNPGLKTGQTLPSVSGPVRGLSVRRGGAPLMAKVGPPPPAQDGPPPPMPRGVARRNTSRRNQEDEDEEGYASGEDFDGPSRSKLNTIRIRIHHDGDVRGMMLSPDTPFDEFMDKLTSRFGSTVTIKFVDEDGIKVSLRDQDDYELAVETARQSSKGKREGKLEIWCTDV
ncbi:NADPH oxidase regulator NoxR [Mycena olivaceomarginata]|nr:NADPH oxidase regulator NoxR [Mycena olivaceomarginata]